MRRALHIFLVSIVLFGVLLFAAELRSQDENKPRDIQTLIRELASSDLEVQENALSDLHYVGVAALPAVPALTKIVAESSVFKRKDALEILGGIGPPAAAAVPDISKALNDSHFEVRIAAAEALLRIAPDHPGAIATFNASLRSNDKHERREAASNIAWLGRLARGCEPALIEAADHEDSQVRFYVADALGRPGLEPGESVVATLRKMLTDKEPTVRVAAAGALWRLEEPAEAVLPTLIQVLKEFQTGTEVRPELQIVQEHLPAEQAANALGRMGLDASSAVPTLIEASEASQMGLRLAAIDALGDIGLPAEPAIDRLDKSLRETKVYSAPFIHHGWCVSDQAANALRKVGPASRNVLIAALSDKDERVRFNAADALGEIQPRTDETVAVLVKLLDDPEASVRVAAVDALGRQGSRAARAAPRLARLLNDDSKLIAFPPGGGIGTSYYLSDRVLVALQVTDGESEAVVAAIVKLLEKDRRLSSALVNMLRLLGRRAVSAVPALEVLLVDPEQRLAVAEALACIAPERDGLHKVFQEALADRDSMEYLLAARGFGDLRSRAAPILPQLLEELDRLSDPDAKAIVAAAIVKIDKRQPRAVVELARGLRDAPELFRCIGHDDAAAAWVALGKDAQPGTELLVSGLHYEVTDPTVRVFDKIRHEANVRLRSAELLIDVSLRTPEAAAGLIELCQSQDCITRSGAADALAKLGPSAAPAVPALVAILPDDELYLVGGDFYGNGGTPNYPGEHAARALAAIGEPAIPALQAALKDDEPDTRERAALALGMIGKRAAAADGELKQARQDRCRAVRRAAGEALKKISTP